MSEQEKFLARWSRRKREAGEETDAPKPAPKTGEASAAEHPADADDRSRAQPAGSATEIPKFDLASLPPIELITAETDIRAFLAPGVPPELTRAALRQAWAADPKIRDFVGLADYDWDFTKPGGAPGFDTLEMTDELRKFAEQIVTGARDLRHAAEPDGHTEPSAKDAASSPTPDDQAIEKNSADRQEKPVSTAPSPGRADLKPGGPTDTAVQQETENRDSPQLLGKRSHGSALPM